MQVSLEILEEILDWRAGRTTMPGLTTKEKIAIQIICWYAAKDISRQLRKVVDSVEEYLLQEEARGRSREQSFVCLNDLVMDYISDALEWHPEWQIKDGTINPNTKEMLYLAHAELGYPEYREGMEKTIERRKQEEEDQASQSDP
jgi:hypothetical protein